MVHDGIRQLDMGMPYLGKELQKFAMKKKDSPGSYSEESYKWMLAQ